VVLRNVSSSPIDILSSPLVHMSTVSEIPSRLTSPLHYFYFFIRTSNDTFHSICPHHIPRPSHRVRPYRPLRPTLRSRRRRLSTPYHPTRLRSTNRHPPRRTPPKRLRPRIRNHSVHRYQHLRIDRLEGVLAYDREHGSRT
jgi:hypothetical protein